MPIGVIGLGEVGTLIVGGLRQADYTVLAFDREPDAVRAAADGGAQPVSSVAEVAGRCGVVLAAVATDSQLRDVAAQLFAVMTSGACVIHSTVAPETPPDLAAAAPGGVSVIDAPVSIHPPGEPRRCVAYVGSEVGVPDEIRGILDAYCREAIIVGGLGAGQVVKLANNTMSLVNTVAAAEALRLAAAHGLDSELVRQLVLKGSGASHALATWPRRASLFESDTVRQLLAVKDLDTAAHAAAALDVEMPLTVCAADLLRRLADAAREDAASA